MVYKRDMQATLFNLASYNGVDGQPTVQSALAVSGHLWLVPLCVFHLRSAGFALQLRHLFISSALVGALSMLTIFMLPKRCIPYGGQGMCQKLNVNMVDYWWGQDDNWYLHLFDADQGNPIASFWVFANFNYAALTSFWWLLLRAALSAGTVQPGHDNKITTTKTTKAKEKAS
mmetsp:Transcript_21034/g.43873  ORF Transcript_21034/g.43873 Transcript_21034/m.43873 type:complete len:173 (-) Transcript_21034:434-952(-)